jgi:CO/xanthine dehydrogenase FAD-binding subunit
VLGVAAAVLMRGDVVERACIALGAAASRPFVVEKANEFLTGKRLDDEVIAEAGKIAASRAKPMDNADLDLYWRKEVAGEFVGYALKELRGDDMREIRLRIARHVM